jgi:hypothetical protein
MDVIQSLENIVHFDSHTHHMLLHTGRRHQHTIAS